MRCSSTKLEGAALVLSPEKLSLMGEACCLPPAHCWGHSLIVLCGYHSLAPCQKSLWNGAGPYWGFLQTARLVAPLSMCSTQECIGGVGSAEVWGLDGAGCAVLARFALVFCGRRPGAKALVQRACPQGNRKAGCADSKLRRGCQPLTGSWLVPTRDCVLMQGFGAGKWSPPAPLFLEKSP